MNQLRSTLPKAKLEEETQWDDVIRDLKHFVRRALLQLSIDELACLTKRDLKLVALGFLAQLEDNDGYQVRFDVKPSHGAFDFFIRNWETSSFILVTVHCESIGITKVSSHDDSYTDLSLTLQELLDLKCIDSVSLQCYTTSHILSLHQSASFKACEALLVEAEHLIERDNWAFHATILCIGRRVESTRVKRVQCQ